MTIMLLGADGFIIFYSLKPLVNDHLLMQYSLISMFAVCTMLLAVYTKSF